MKTIIAFDFGLRQIGVATGNTELGTGRALTTLKAKGGKPDWTALEKIVREWQPDLLVVGEPLNMDGSDSELARLARKFARLLHGRLGLPVEMADERLTSFEAKQTLREQGHTGDYQKEPADSLAAELILQTWFSAGGKPPD